MKKTLRNTTPRNYTLEVMQKKQNIFLEVREIYLEMGIEENMTLNAVYRASRELYEAGFLEKKKNERSGRISYRYKQKRITKPTIKKERTLSLN